MFFPLRSFLFQVSVLAKVPMQNKWHIKIEEIQGRGEWHRLWSYLELAAS